MSVLFINPAFRFEPPEQKGGHVLFPFGIGYIASYIRERDHEVGVWDILIEEKGYDDVLRQIRSGILDGYDYIGITAIVTQFSYVKRLIEDIKAHTDVPVMVGGALSTHSHELLLKHTKTDICILGPGEVSTEEILSGANLADVEGIAFRTDDGAIVRTPDRKLPKDLNIFPPPAYDLFDVEFYVTHTGLMDVVRPFYKGLRVAAMITARGCPYSCNFCSKSVHGVGVRDIDSIMEEVDYFVREHKVQAIHFVDELLVITKKRLLEICRRLKPLGLKWDCQARVNLVDEEMLRAMKDAGCVCVGFGIESGSQKILKRMNKQITVEQIRSALSICREINLPVKAQLIYGYPGESLETLDETVNLFKELKCPVRRFSVIKPLPGAELWEEAKQDGHIGLKFTELEYIERLCAYFQDKGIQYNKTELSDEVFFELVGEYELKSITNFLKESIKNPVDFFAHWEISKCYLRHLLWENNNIPQLRFIAYIRQGVRHPDQILPFIVRKVREAFSG
ncbi:radical SAM protein [Pseudodesulfovibrio sp. zrk46]|uniref:B12-binding domain-containing radical SAM protein n=1 Tax=Pseudodesulfovibrio sp. zrk46 TaxID=2725288 RepID=UPI00144994E2|nr:radical SAM protein [Pseudodesulfovibrio sp. zrk46]QJB56586.1 radical SAM protein [Pseudodesulfovibrio sp. zrk46]